METKTASRAAARMSTVEEHIRCENAHDLEGIMATFGGDARYDDEPWHEHHMGRDGVHAHYEGLLEAVPDLSIEVDRRYVTEEAIVLEVTIGGTHLGEWRGLPATGRRIEFPLCAVYTFDGGDRLAGERIYYDRATVLRQLGVFHEPESVLGKALTPVMHPITLARALGRKLGARRDGIR